ncbi:beta-ketoacyl-ACP synthase III [Piscinibacter sp. HJYY11]|uniref:beta-ketoacyl-ACP synthase III n=1 Tax=Piscinibacter sp. HJYY11 TaxID=2801333 RepID=UPI00191F3816|nr:beta-ketoacyl-ACP synthase III [Piscinibacter sp. HJYY11]MBL0729584.1 beta-ketoacyl-ACP synthase III [Piscinibacter sp. HJYY11]
MSKAVYVTGISRFLPNAPVENEAMEAYLGMINGKPSRARRVVLRNNGIQTRHYALEKGGTPTHSNAQLAAASIRLLFDARFTQQKLQLLACGTASPDQLVPSHAAMVHAALGGDDMEIASFAGSCAASIQALQMAYLSIASGHTENAICSGSEMLSHWMLAKYFQNEADNELALRDNPLLSFDKEFLRWMLSDGSGAIRLENKAHGDRPLKIEWIDIRSYANKMPTCMYVAGERDEAGELQGYCRFEPNEWLSKSIMSVKQDTRLLGSHIVQLAVKSLKDAAAKHDFDVATVDHYLPHISSEVFRNPLCTELKEQGIGIPLSKWFTNLAHVGNVATASMILMLEELARTKELRSGQKILITVPESARFSYGHALLTVC